MKQFTFVIIFLLIVQLLPMTSIRSVTSAESALPSPTNELSNTPPTQLPTTSLQTTAVVSEVRATVTETAMPVQSTTIDPTQTATVNATQTATVNATQTATVNATQTATVNATQTATVNATQTATVNATQTATVNATQTATVNATQTVANSTNTPTMTEPAQSQPSSPLTKSSDSEPVIFVPGIMGSYLDYINPNDNNNVCNIWPTSARFIPPYSMGRCKIVSWGGIGWINEEGHKNILIQLNNPKIYATDAIRDQRHVGYLGDAYVKIMDSLNKVWPEYQGGSDKKFFFKPAIERCEIIKTKVEQGELRRNQTLLYAFGYDWRQSTATNAVTLSNFIDCVRETHNNAKVSLVGHSMGGLVIKQLLLNHNNSDSVARVSTFNTPYLGSVRALHIMGTGEYDSISTVILSKDKLKTVARNIPGAIELLPSSLYLNQYPCRLVTNGNETCTTGEYWQRVGSVFGNQATQYQLTSAVGRDDTGAIVEQTKQIDYLIQFSSNKNTTIAKVNSTNWTNEMGFGDGTVNEFSLTRRLAGIDYNPQTTSNRKVYIFGYCDMKMGSNDKDPKIDHMRIVNYSEAVNRLIMFLRSDPALATIKQNTCINGNSVDASKLTIQSTVLLQPDNNFISTNGLWPTLTWVDGIRDNKTGYRIQVSANRDMSNPIVNECTTTRSYRPKSDSWARSMIGTFYWRVNYITWDPKKPVSCVSQEPVTGWSSIRSFTNTRQVPSYTAHWTLSDLYQHIVAVGDVNGDKYADIGAFDDSGLLRIWFGRSTGLRVNADQSVYFADGGIIIPVCDVSGDKYADMLVREDNRTTWFVPGSASGLNFAKKIKMQNSVDWRTMCFGDVTGDKINDVVIVGETRIEVINGGRNFPKTVSSTSTLCTANDATCMVGVAGDANGDGINDIALVRKISGVRKVELYRGKSSGIFGSRPLSTITNVPNYANNYFATWVSSVGDVNKDGYDDLGVTQYWDGVMVYKGSRTGYASKPSWMVTGFDAGYVSSAGDINDDGYDDLYVGSPWQATARIFLGNINSLDSTPAWIETGNGHFAWPGGDAGDIDGNGKNDIFVGAHYYNGVAKVFLFR